MKKKMTCLTNLIYCCEKKKELHPTRADSKKQTTKLPKLRKFLTKEPPTVKTESRSERSIGAKITFQNKVKPARGASSVGEAKK
jgi:hypothetical protein